MFGVGDGPPPLPGLDGFILTPQAPFEATITLGTLFITLFLLLFAKHRKHTGKICCGVWIWLTSVHILQGAEISMVSRMSFEMLPKERT